MEPTTAAAVKRQIEYYFGDSNFPKDKHLQSKALEDPEGWIPIEHINTFERMKKFGVTAEQIAEVLKDSTVVTLNEDKTKIKRTNPIPEVDTTDLRSVYVRGLPLSSTIDQVIEFFENEEIQGAKYHVEQVRMRRFMGKGPDAGRFKGSCFVTLPTEEAAENLWKAYGAKEGDQPFQPAGIEGEFNPSELRKSLLIRKKLEYQKWKRDSRRRHSDDDKSGHGEPDSKKKPFEIVTGLILRIEGIGKKWLDEETKKPTDDAKNSQLPGLTRISAEECEGFCVTRELLSLLFSSYGHVRFVSFSVGDDHAEVRFDQDSLEAAKKAVTELGDGKLTLGGSPVTLRVMEGEEEQAYWKNIMERTGAANAHRRHHGNQRRGGHRK